MKDSKIKAFYSPKQVCRTQIVESSFSKSPLKPMLYMQYLQDRGFGGRIEIEEAFAPYTNEDFELAHTSEYVDKFFSKMGDASSGLPWSEELAESIRYTNSSLYHAIKYSIENPTTVTLSPTSGFHHASPKRGESYCTFSGQVIASKKIFEESGLRAAYLDLDGHFGNSIEDSKDFVQDLENAIPVNFNPSGEHESYVKDLDNFLIELTELITNGEVDYVVWCHGADSHEWDSLGGQCTTEEWIECSKMFYGWVADMKNHLGIEVPVTLSLFGGYRDDHYESVLSLHTSDLRECINELTEESIDYDTVVLHKDMVKLNKENWTHRSYKDMKTAAILSGFDESLLKEKMLYIIDKADLGDYRSVGIYEGKDEHDGLYKFSNTTNDVIEIVTMDEIKIPVALGGRASGTLAVGSLAYSHFTKKLLVISEDVLKSDEYNIDGKGSHALQVAVPIVGVDWPLFMSKEIKFHYQVEGALMQVKEEGNRLVFKVGAKDVEEVKNVIDPDSKCTLVAMINGKEKKIFDLKGQVYLTNENGNVKIYDDADNEIIIKVKDR